ncbi:molybdenum ABC transporter ATP-binding protein [Pigmentiphaga aceris]|uniref:Molybdenum ABC transporter ATP-binding protein n=1 Tax=Pigmentiphaga aceris TaxID=1940612 RepID=A0A5C0AWA8_9BURK|nr:molybdenum ABC transporter ATP-binding protein [Pigmentiphaga aceris]QEI05160.1 molybdenum ABC transporter ATP-binding protein [Pigmentiphaga aceris]
MHDHTQDVIHKDTHHNADSNANRNVDSNTRIEARFLVRHAGFSLDVNLDLPGRGVSGLFGHSGSGKTTCLRCVAGLEKPDSGYLRVNGEVWLDSDAGISLPTHKRPLGYVFQEPSLFPHLNVLRNLQFGQKRVPTSQHQVQLEQATALLGIDHLLERMPAGLSGGERQRVGIARALLTSPRLLLMDEPLAALDLKRKREILPYLERLHDELDIPVIYVSHSPEEMARLADHLVVLDGGKVIASGPIADTLSRLDLPAARTDDASVVVEGTAGDFDTAYGLLTVHLPESNSTMRLVHARIATGQRVRLAVKARDVSLTTSDQEGGSILNRLPVTVLEVAPAENPDHVIVRLNAGGTLLLARITRYSSDRLAVVPGQALWAQIKAVSLLT